ncbi:hypothetical protein [Sphingomonas sp.]|jgi:hypothetical protein|uniref:hypothetical protein n=1 Tax=Sphingomonas sp. TaxID=28214 RepID=UPI00262E1EEF|nr:hypothetical protein [Sphingomonas sp.]MDF2494565.1 hypothetical protein [Sphingomonas sp.]
MPWYRTGTVTVTNGSAIVTGAGTDFVGNVSIGEGFVAPDRGVYEVAQVISATQLQLATAYQGATAGGQGFSMLPTQSQMRDLAIGAAQLLNTFGAVRDGIGQGLIADGSPAAPGLRFAADQDTGLVRTSANRLALVTGGQVRLELSSDAQTTFYSSYIVSGGSGARPPIGLVGSENGQNAFIFGGQGLVQGEGAPDNGPTIYAYFTNPIRFYTSTGERMRIDGMGNLLVGVLSGTCHRISKSVGLGNPILQIRDEAQGVAALAVQSVNQANYSSMGAGLFAGVNTSTGRTMNAGGTINAVGADYAEYMPKAAGCGIIAKGDVCGVDRVGRLTKTWADAVSFVIKSTDPSLVGGDTWAAHLRPKPEQPGAEPQAPAFPAAPTGEADEASVAAWVAAQAAYPALLASYQSEHAAWQQAVDAYAADLAAWQDELETARQCVDRIAFCGQVPCNVTGEFDAGDYIIAAANGAGIKAIAVKPDAITLPQYMRRIGKVWAIRDGRAWIDVQHG